MSKKKKNLIKPNYLKKNALPVLSILVSAWFIVWIVVIVKNMSYPQVDYSEGFNMWNAHLFGSGQWQFNPLQGPPYNAMFYPPVWYIVVGKFTQIFGDSLIVGRLFNILSVIGCMVVIYLIVSHITKSKIYGYLGALFPLMSSTMLVWSIFPRVDMLAILFDLIGIYILIRFDSSNLKWFSILFFVLAFYTKQSIAGGILAACIYLILKDWKKGIIYSCVLGGLILVIFGIANILTQGDFYKQVVTWQLVPHLTNSVSIFNVIEKLGLVVLPTIALSGYYCLKHPRTLVSIYVLSAILVNTLSLLHVGGNANYYFESLFALGMVSGICLKEVIEAKREFFVYLFAFSVAGLVLLIPSQDFGDNVYPARYKEAVDLIQDATYPVLTENAQLVLDAGKEPYYEPFVYTNMIAMGNFDGDIILNDLRENKIQYVITQYKPPYWSAGRFNPEIRQAISDNYHIIMDSPPKEVPGVHDFVVYEANNRR